MARPWLELGKNKKSEMKGFEQTEAAKISERNLILQAIVCIFVGLLLVVSDVLLEFFRQPGATPSKILEYAPLLKRLLEGIGIASVVFGIFSLFLELPGLRRYFLQRMKDLVIGKAYLKTLSREELLDLQVGALAAQYKNEEVAREGGFLDFLREHIYAYINEPHRERVTLEIRYEDGDDGLFLAKDRLSYICRKSGGKIIDTILWHNDPGEIEDVKNLKVTVRYPQEKGGLGEPVIIGELVGDTIFIFKDAGRGAKRESGDYAEDENFLRKDEKAILLAGKGLHIIGGESYRNVDFLNVTVDAEYTVRKSHLLYWSMSYPTRDFSLVLRFPRSYIVQAAAFINSAHVGELADERGYYSFSYNSWMIPQSGVSWRLIPGSDQSADLVSPSPAPLAPQE